jgi:two-component system, chemotaxis family, protein-glutamate methylesterase/glutaminase
VIRVLIADDSATARQLLIHILESDAEIRVIGQAANGVDAVEMTRRLRPDLVTMDVQMPRLDGFEATKQIMIEAPTPIVIVSASVDPREVSTSMSAIRAGALTVLAKPAGPGAADFDEVAAQLVSTVKALSQVKVVRQWPARQSKLALSRRGGRARVVALAASTGGPAAVHHIVGQLPREFPAPILLVQHIAHGFLAGFAAWLDRATALKVTVAQHGEALAPGCVYVAPEDRHLGVALAPQMVATTSAAPPVGGFRPAASFLFDSVAQACGDTAVAVVLTGMGSDGVDGLRAVSRVGGRVLVQDEQTSVVFGMPGAALAAGIAAQVVPLPDMARRLLDLVMET